MLSAASDDVGAAAAGLRRLVAALAFILAAATTTLAADLTATAWQPVELAFEGPDDAAAGGGINPFLDRRLDVIFRGPDERTFTIPGFFDGNGEGGGRWRARFTPDAPGGWTYEATFYAGDRISIAQEPGEALAENVGQRGKLDVVPRDARARGFLAKGRLVATGDHYLLTRGDGRHWIKTGTGDPIDLLAYQAFDAADAAGQPHAFIAHRDDWGRGDVDWSDDTTGLDGRNLVGAVNYLAGRGVNSIAVRPLYLDNLGRTTHPYLDPADPTRFNIARLDQWERLFAHAQASGVHLNVVVEVAGRGPDVDDATKLLCRELVARFGHHNALQWTLHEASTPGGEGDVPPASAMPAAASWLAGIDAYDHPIAVRRDGISWRDPTGEEWRHVVGDGAFTSTSLEATNGRVDWGELVEAARIATLATGRPGPAMADGPSVLDAPRDDPDDVRRETTWDVLLSGGGLEWREFGGVPTIENFRPFERIWDEASIARRFLEDHTPFWRMRPADELLRGEDRDFGGGEVLALDGQVYALYLPDGSNDDNRGQPPEFDLRGHAADFSLRWLEPRSGRFVGDPVPLAGGAWVSLGATPDGIGDRSDWAALITRDAESGPEVASVNAP